MPRLNNDHENDSYYSNSGNPQSDADVCNDCVDGIVGQQFTGETYPGEPVGVFGNDVDHPPYEDDDYHCCVCGELLTNQDH